MADDAHRGIDGKSSKHRAYHAAYDSDTFSAVFEADYESGDLTISVEEEEDCQSKIENV